MQKVESENTPNLLTNFILFSGALCLLTYILSYKNFFYIPWILALYFLGLISRKVIFKTPPNPNVTELGIFFLSVVLTGYIINFLRLDPKIQSILPATIISKIAPAYLFLLIVSSLPDRKKFPTKGQLILILFLILIIIKRFENSIRLFFSSNIWVSDLIFGSPIAYLLLLVFGVNPELLLNKIKS